MMQTLHSFVDVNFFYSLYLGLLGTYMSHGLGLPRYLISENKNEVKELAKIYKNLFQKLMNLNDIEIESLTNKKFIAIFGSKFLEKINPYINIGNYHLDEKIKWSPNVFIQLKFDNTYKIYPLFYSNYFLNEIIQIKIGKIQSGEASTRRGLSFEDEIFGFCETINVTGELNGIKLLRVKNPNLNSNVKELADLIFIGNKTQKVYIISAKTHIVLTFKSLLKELKKFHEEQSEIKIGLQELKLDTSDINWIFLSPTTWLANYKNIMIYNTNQLVRLLYNNEGSKEIDLQSENDTFKLSDFNKIGIFDYKGRRFTIEICKIHGILKDEIAIWIPKPEIKFALIYVDIPDFIDIKHLKEGQWIKILFEIRTKFSTQIMAFHDAVILNENEVSQNFLKRKIYPPYP